MCNRIKSEPLATDAVLVGVLKRRSLRTLFVLAAVFIGLVVFPLPSAFGLVVGSTDTSEFNEPTSPWFGMNWDYVYETGAGTSVAIDGWHLLSASHYSLSAGITFTTGSDTFEIIDHELPPVDTGETYRPDLQIIEVQNITNPGIPLPGHYELYEGSFSIDQDTIIVGTGHTGTDHSSYYTYDSGSARERRWGTNRIEKYRLGIATTGRKVVTGWSTWSTMAFRTEYSSSDTDYEAGLADHDSGAGVFILDDGVWKLAGIGLYTEPYSSGYDDNFYASIPDYIDWIQGTFPGFVFGDANGDGVVSAGDYAAVQANFGNTGDPGILGDANGDGLVSAGDYACIQSNFGNAAPATASSANNVPEPGTIFILACGAVAIFRRHRRG